MKRKQINGTIRITALIILALAFIGAGLFTVSVYRKPAVQKVEEPTYKFNQAGAADYRVRLKPNNLYAKPVLGPGKIYVANFIDKIDVDFKYMFSTQVAAKVYGTYTVSAVLEAYEPFDQQSGKQKSVKVWEKEFPLAPPGEFAFSSDKGEFKKTVAVDYPFFKRFVDAVNKAAETNTGEASLLVKCKMIVEADTPKGIRKQVLTPTLTVPVGPKIFEIGKPSAAGKPIVINSTKTVVKPEVRRERMVFSLVTAGLLVLLVAFLQLTKPVLPGPESRMLARINKKYGDRIVETAGADIPQTDKIITVDTIDGLVKVADELAKPVFHRLAAGGKTHMYYVFDGFIRYQCEIGSGTFIPSMKNSDQTFPLQH